MKFLGWEIENGALASAMNRLKTAAWPPELWPHVILVAGPFIAAGVHEKIAEIRRLARLSGGEIDSCIVTISLAQPSSQTRELGSAAKLRRLACRGEIRAALDAALSHANVSLRVSALGIVAEGMAGIPGSSDEMLEL
jgi:hypothetical protein